MNASAWRNGPIALLTVSASPGLPTGMAAARKLVFSVAGSWPISSHRRARTCLAHNWSRGHILRYKCDPGQMHGSRHEWSAMSTSYDAGRVTHVPAATASRAVNGHDHAREVARARLQVGMGEHGRHPDGEAEVIARRRKKVIGLLYTECTARRHDVEDTKVIYEDELLRGVNRVASELEWSVLVTFWAGNADQDLRRLAAISEKVDGMLVSTGSFPPRLLEWLASQVPVTVIAGNPAETKVDVVIADNRSGKSALVTHLLEGHGKRRIYHGEGTPPKPDAAQRRIGLQQALRDHPAARLVGTTAGSFYVESGLAAGRRILAEFREDLPDAVVAANDQVAIGVLRSFNAAGVLVPEQVAVVGFDDIYHGVACEPPLTTVHQPMRLLGERACARLLERIAAPSLPHRVDLLPTELVLRRSCGCTQSAPSAVPSNAGTLRPLRPLSPRTPDRVPACGCRRQAFRTLASQGHGRLPGTLGEVPQIFRTGIQ